MSRPVIVALTGASGAPYGLRLIDVLLKSNREVQVIVSAAGRMVLALESKLALPERQQAMEKRLRQWFCDTDGKLHVVGLQEWTSPAASGSGQIDAMVVCPCTMATLAAIATGAGRNLIDRAADVMIKEHRKLVLVPRETPFSAIHLGHMLLLAQLGVTILPPNPGFYQNPTTISDLVDFIVARILDHLDVEHSLSSRWGYDKPGTASG